MKKTALILSILLAPTVLNAQIEIGQLKIPSFEAFFNVENTAYWDDIGAFAVNGQEYFIPNFPSMINSRNDQLSIELAFKGNLDVGDVRYELTNQFVRQFGQPVAIENTSGFQLSNTGWIIEENDLEFIVALPRNPNDGKLIILKVGE